MIFLSVLPLWQARRTGPVMYLYAPHGRIQWRQRDDLAGRTRNESPTVDMEYIWLTL
jgi:hypothetical protein